MRKILLIYQLLKIFKIINIINFKFIIVFIDNIKEVLLYLFVFKLKSIS